MSAYLVEWEGAWIADEEFMDDIGSRTYSIECAKVFDDLSSAQKRIADIRKIRAARNIKIIPVSHA